MEITLNFKSLFRDLYDSFLERKRIDPEEEFRDMKKGIFDRWLEFDFSFDDFDEITEIKTKVDNIIQSLCREYSATSISKNFYSYVITLPAHSFSLFYKENKSNILVDWNTSLIQNFTDSEILENYSEHFYLNSFIQNHKDWNTKLVRKYCSEIDDLRDILSLNVDWDVETLDYVLESFTVDGKIKRPQYNDWNKSEIFEPQLTARQVKLFKWDSYNLKKYLDLITYCDGYTIDDKKFVDDFYHIKDNWSFNELILFQDNIDWYYFVTNYKFITNDFLVKFKDKINPKALLYNQNYTINSQFIKDNISSLEINDIGMSHQEVDIDLFLFLENYYKSKPYLNFFKNIIKEAALSEDLVFFLEPRLNLSYTEETYIRRGSWDDGEHEIEYKTFSYWKLLATNSKMVWTDKLVNKFSNKLVL